jgi:hypothetical protein
MKEKLTITLDVSKINKSRIVERKFNGKEGEVTKKEYKLDIIPLKTESFIKEGPGWKMIKTHFVAETVSKEEKARGVKGNIVGDGIVFRNVEHGVDMGEDNVNENQIPF